RPRGSLSAHPRNRKGAAQPDRSDEALRAHPDHSDGDTVGPQVRQVAREPGLRPQSHAIPQEQQHPRLWAGRQGEDIGDVPRNPRCDVAVREEVRTGACGVRTGAVKTVSPCEPDTRGPDQCRSSMMTSLPSAALMLLRAISWMSGHLSRNSAEAS